MGAVAERPLIVDSFAPRGSSNACEGGVPTVPQAAMDAIDARKYLATQPFVDEKRVAVMGWSHALWILGPEQGQF